MSALSVTAIAGGIVLSLLILAAFVGALVLSKRSYSLTTTFKVAPRPWPKSPPVRSAGPSLRDVTEAQKREAAS